MHLWRVAPFESVQPAHIPAVLHAFCAWYWRMFGPMETIGPICRIRSARAHTKNTNVQYRMGMALVVLPVRLWLAWRWSWHVWHKLWDPRWVGVDAGAGVRCFLVSAIERARNDKSSVHPMYAQAARRLFLPLASPISYLVLVSEALLPIGLLVPRSARGAAALGAPLNLMFLGGGGAPRDNSNMLLAELAIMMASKPV